VTLNAAILIYDLERTERLYILFFQFVQKWRSWMVGARNPDRDGIIATAGFVAAWLSDCPFFSGYADAAGDNSDRGVDPGRDLLQTGFLLRSRARAAICG